MSSGFFFIPADLYNHLAAASGAKVGPLLRTLLTDFITAPAAQQDTVIAAYQFDDTMNTSPLLADDLGLDHPTIWGPLRTVTNRTGVWEETLIAAVVQQHMRGHTPSPAETWRGPSAADRARALKLRL